MSLHERLARRIRAEGPLDVAAYMEACLHDPDFGYYATRPGLGASGDFITAPLVSQMFGELIGLWAAECWMRLGRPERLRLVEAGPGDGTLMGDMLRAGRAAPDFLAAAEVWLVETSAPLRVRQRKRLGEATRWVESLSEVPTDAPAILVANELLDCLPARQFVRGERGWVERKVGLDAGGRLAFALDGWPAALASAPEAPAGAVFETSDAQKAFAAAARDLVAQAGGALLLIDYGDADAGPGDTLQALKGHLKVDPLESPGEADLTVHAQFAAVLDVLRQGLVVPPLLTQASFLSRLGIEVRAAALAAARPDRTGQIARQLERLTAPDQMGELFKVACAHTPGWTPPGFEAAA